MSTNSETKFLITVLYQYGYNPHKQDCAQFLADLCQTNHQIFLEICHDLIQLLIPTIAMPIQSLSDDILEVIAKDLYQILVPLWTLHMYNEELVKHIHKAQNMISNASVERNRTKKANYVEKSFDLLNITYLNIKAILSK